MLVFGHAGITLGAVTILNGLFTGVAPADSAPEEPAPGGLSSWFIRLNRRWDLRILLVGALLPDIIDKPLGHLLFQEYLSSGRTFAHTLLFTVLIILGGLFIRYRTGKNWMLILSLGTSTHLILDEMWLQHWRSTILWPLYGLEFPKAEITDWTGNLWYALLHEPSVYIPEIIGGAVLLLFLWVLIRNRNLISFLKHGRLSDV